MLCDKPTFQTFPHVNIINILYVSSKIFSGIAFESLWEVLLFNPLDIGYSLYVTGS